MGPGKAVLKRRGEKEGPVGECGKECHIVTGGKIREC